MLTPGASTLPQGRALISTYVYDVIEQDRYDASGTRHPTAGEHDLGSLAYLIYGLTDRVTVVLLPRIGFNEPVGAHNSSALGVGDLGAEVQYGVTSFHQGSWVPATSVVLAETFPTGRYDRLERPSEGFGTGAFTTAVSWYSQDYFWLPNGRILRVRFDLTYAISSSTAVHDASVYGTARGFRGQAYPGDGATADAAVEYSLNRSWVLATDLVYQYNGNTSVTGSDLRTFGTPGSVDLQSGASEYFAVAPAIEFSWSARAGVIVGVRLFVTGRNVTASVTPVAAINLLY